MPYSRAAAFAAAVTPEASEVHGPPEADPRPARGVPQSAAPAVTLAAGPLTPAEGSLRAYAVWALPGHPELRGVHAGGALAWHGLVALLPGNAYSFESGVRLRGYATPGAAVDGFLSEAARHGCPSLAIFRWQSASARLRE